MFILYIMKIFIRTVCFHFICILFFSLLYFFLKNNFQKHINQEFTLLDYFLLSTTIQAGVGISNMYPNTDIGKTLMIIQQLIKITTHVFTVYIFTL